MLGLSSWYRCATRRRKLPKASIGDLAGRATVFVPARNGPQGSRIFQPWFDLLQRSM
jgi:hypothetical protein